MYAVTLSSDFLIAHQRTARLSVGIDSEFWCTYYTMEPTFKICEVMPRGGGWHEKQTIEWTESDKQSEEGEIRSRKDCTCKGRRKGILSKFW